MKQIVTFLVIHLFILISIKSFGDNQARDYYRKGAGFFEEGSWQEAESQFSQAIQSDPDYTIAYIARGGTRVRLRNYEGALEDLNIAIEKDPSYPEAFSIRGIIWKKRGNFEKAIKDFNTALQLKPYFVDALYNLGDTYFELKEDYYSALEYYKRVLALNPHHEKALKKIEITKQKIRRFEASKLHQLKKQA